jgi:hypothetical protein
MCFVSRAGNSKRKGKIMKQVGLGSFHILTPILGPAVCRAGLVVIPRKPKGRREKFIKPHPWLSAWPRKELKSMFIITVSRKSTFTSAFTFL